MLRVLIFILALFSVSSSLSARETMNQKYEKAAIIGRQAIEAKSVETRSELIQSIKGKYSFIPYVWSLIPTYDITNKYSPYIQRYKLSCEIAATKMVMDSLGTHVSEDDIFYRIPIFSGSLGENGIWGNPEKEFVGDIGGSQYNKTGYGIYEAPLASYLNERGFDAKIMNASTYQKGMSANKHLMTLLGQITKGSRVILWGDYCTTPSLEDGILADNSYKTLMKLFPIAAKNHCDRKSDDRIFSWKTPDGIEARGISGEHAFLLLGYIGNINHPTHIIVWDTSTGRHVFQYDEWMRKWSLLQFRSLIVRKKSS